jgi:endo-1,4-beta-xylanase
MALAAALPAVRAYGAAPRRVSDGPMPRLVEMTGERSLRAHAEAAGLLVGCAVVPEKLDGEPAYGATVAEQANLLVPENAMKWAALRPAIDRFDFRRADEILAFAATHNQKVRGHNLCWHEALPDWFAGEVNAGNAHQILVQHIETVAGRYAGKLHSWDVVNEAVEPRDGRPDGLRNSPWLQLLGPGYLETAYRAARQADPAALLTYNDYGIELDTPEQTEKRAQVLMLLRRMKARGVPLDAMGVQSHLTANQQLPGAGLRDFVRECRRMGLQVFVTELDINDRLLPAAVAERDAAVAQLYRDYLTMMLAEPNVTAVLTWGVTDRYTWLDQSKWGRTDGKPQRPLPFDSDYQPAPAFFAERAALDSRRRQQIGGLPANDPYAPFTPNLPQPRVQHE